VNRCTALKALLKKAVLCRSRRKEAPINGRMAYSRSNRSPLTSAAMFSNHALNRASRPATRVAFGIFLALSLPLPGWAKLALSPIFSDHMVLQRSERTILWGYGAAPGGRVWVKYKNRGKAWASAADSKGVWRVELNLTNAAAYRSPCTLVIGEGKKRRPVLQLTDVVLADVWLLAVAEGQGIQAQPGDIQLLHPDRIHILDLRRFDANANPLPTDAPLWQECPKPADLGLLSTLAVCSAEYLAMSAEVAIVEVPAGILDESLEAAGRMAEDVPSSITNAWVRANFDVRTAQAERWEKLIEAKQRGVVTNIPPIFEYGSLAVYPPGAFSPAKPPNLWLTFRGAIWPGRTPAASGRAP
jgi:hypothetical protein